MARPRSHFLLDIGVPFDRIAIVKKGWNVLAARTPEQL